jgi:hypothetical protein
MGLASDAARIDSIDPARINSILVHGGLAVSRLALEQPSLEDFFLEITDSEMFQECATR